LIIMPGSALAELASSFVELLLHAVAKLDETLLERRKKRKAEDGTERNKEEHGNYVRKP